MKRTLSIAIVGADGSGKSTVIRELLRTSPDRYLYMGASIDSANYALPTSRWLMRRKRRALGDVLGESDAVPPAAIMSGTMKSRLPQGRLFKAVGLMNRVAEEWYRALIAGIFRLRGWSVLYDRHFLFEYCPNVPHTLPKDAPLSERIHRWQLAHLYPQPDLVIFLDAPAEVLYQRKREWTVEHLRRQRESILAEAPWMRHFARVDATQSLETVLAEIKALIARQRSPA